MIKINNTMDVIETIDAIFDDLLPAILKVKDNKHALEALMMQTKRSIICASAANPLNTCYIMQNLTPIEYIQCTEPPK